MPWHGRPLRCPPGQNAAWRLAGGRPWVAPHPPAAPMFAIQPTGRLLAEGGGLGDRSQTPEEGISGVTQPLGSRVDLTGFSLGFDGISHPVKQLTPGAKNPNFPPKSTHTSNLTLTAPLEMAHNHPPNPYFQQLSKVPSVSNWKCLVCGRKGMEDYGPHSHSAKHLEAVARYNARQAAENMMMPGLQEPDPPGAISPAPVQDNIFDEITSRSDTPERAPSPFTALHTLAMAEERQISDSDDSDGEVDLQKLAEAFRVMEEDMWGEEGDEAIDAAALEADLRTSTMPVEEASQWYPFKKKEGY
ncbi:uncharacterized protein MELLADRAFT_88032 [Melampsora larici-populina 98AG31]|uniref:Uncharacterized protein n=1 Tax=Melampsora larici-populina (strain 98AG31 / pathotype 3-4-7) TaxID=747676 RepID=F4RQ60_MELLP|nr:uncharacterized protein MELLADRAFT_88032 [Melampsora larici-populina 98AG31]EGG05465.1 hypothetical protein MELLADRAFT_88032 [Melampsora larici-populina 98AG31]